MPASSSESRRHRRIERTVDGLTNVPPLFGFQDRKLEWQHPQELWSACDGVRQADPTPVVPEAAPRVSPLDIARMVMAKAMPEISSGETA